MNKFRNTVFMIILLALLLTTAVSMVYSHNKDIDLPNDPTEPKIKEIQMLKETIQLAEKKVTNNIIL